MKERGQNKELHFIEMIEISNHPWIVGVQFHPESIASEYGHMILKNFIDMSEEKDAV